jgi:hypothetical protein
MPNRYVYRNWTRRLDQGPFPSVRDAYASLGRKSAEGDIYTITSMAARSTGSGTTILSGRVPRGLVGTSAGVGPLLEKGNETRGWSRGAVATPEAMPSGCPAGRGFHASDRLVGPYRFNWPTLDPAVLGAKRRALTEPNRRAGVPDRFTRATPTERSGTVSVEVWCRVPVADR